MKTTVRDSPATLAILAVLVLAGLGLRIGYAVDQPYSPPPDARAYARIAENLQTHGSFDARPERSGRGWIGGRRRPDGARPGTGDAPG